MKSILILLLSLISFKFCYAQNVGQEYEDFKVYKKFKKALRNKSDALVLDMSNQKLLSLPENIGELQSLKVLRLSGNQISNFPNSFWKLKQLEVLVISNNNLSELPVNLSSLKSLKKLYISSNKLKSIPNSLTLLQNLKILDLSFNELDDSDADFIREALPNCIVIVYLKL